MLRLGVIVAVLGGCVTSSSTACENGDRCPEGTACALLTIANEPSRKCVLPDQLTSCEGVADGTECAVRGVPATCHQQVCLPDECGNDLVDFTEVCDDGNTLPGDGCSATCVSNESCGNAIVDLIAGESCDLGDALAHDGCSSTCEVEQPTWDAPQPGRPLPRRLAAAAYDVARRRVVVFGGSALSGISTVTFAGTHEWDGRRWSRPGELAAPLPRTDHRMAYDATRSRLVMVGGAAQETWERTREGIWQLRTPADRPPRDVVGMAYDIRHQRMVLVGNEGSFGTWTWDGENWQQLAGPQPMFHSRTAVAYDPRRGVIVMIGGAFFNGTLFDDVWELDGDTWTQKQPTGGPSPRESHALAYDPVTEEVLLVGGHHGGTVDAETWGWNGQRWRRLADPVPIAPDTGFRDHTMATDPARGRVVLIGTRGDTHEWDGVRWTLVDATVTPTPVFTPRCFHAASLDPVRREVVVYGGTANDSAITTFGDTWIWNGTWRRSTTAPAPSPRFGATVSYDAARDEHVLFGGCSSTFVRYAETWVWRSDRWTQKFPATSPPGRCYHASAYDAERGRVVVFGGQGGIEYDDTWTWDGVTWTLQPPTPALGGRMGMNMAYDPVRKEIVMFGGESSGQGKDETWLWNGQTWTQPPTTFAPTPRAYSPLAWDAARARMMLFAGAASGTVSADVWAWDGASWSPIPTPRPPAARTSHAMVSAFDGYGVLVIGGYLFNAAVPNGPLGDLWRLTWDDVGIQDVCTDHDTDGDGEVGCDDPDCWSSCTPLCPPATSCDLAPRCGDDVCNVALESCDLCPDDCGICMPRCGDFTCDAGETMTSCPGDCLP